MNKLNNSFVVYTYIYAIRVVATNNWLLKILAIEFGNSSPQCTMNQAKLFSSPVHDFLRNHLIQLLLNTLYFKHKHGHVLCLSTCVAGMG